MWLLPERLRTSHRRRVRSDLLTEDHLDALLAARRARLAQAAFRQTVELRTRQQTGKQAVGPWAPAVRLVRPQNSEPARTFAVVASVRRSEQAS
jgi:hypothetical protein